MYIRKCDALLTKARGKKVDERSNHHHDHNGATIDNTNRIRTGTGKSTKTPRSQPIQIPKPSHIRHARRNKKDLHQDFPQMESAPTASQRRDMHICVRAWQVGACMCVHEDLPDSQPVQASAGRCVKRAQETDARYPPCRKRKRVALALSLPLTLHASSGRRSSCLSHPSHSLTASQPLSCCAAPRCDALHTAFSGFSPRDLSATADLALPVSLALPRLPACLSHLLASYSSWAPGSEVGKYPSTCADSLGLDGGEGPGST
jgi:hypothetical protein